MIWVFLGSVSIDFTIDDLSEIVLNGTVYDFSVDRSTIEKEDILNIHEHFKEKNKIKRVLSTL